MKATSQIVQQVDSVLLLITAISVLLLALITILMIFFVIKYHKSRHPKSERVEEHPLLEITWTVVPLILVMGMFYYGLEGYRTIRNPPKDSFIVKVIGQQWQWRYEYPNGKKSENLHVPIHKPVKLLMTSVDVIHSFYIPAYRVKMDVLPNRETYLWFEATDLGSYDVFCAEYCGLLHSGMLSKVIVMEEDKFNEWYNTKDPVEEVVEAKSDATSPSTPVKETSPKKGH